MTKYVTPKVDIFSLGLLMWELVAQEVPWKNCSDMHVPWLVRNGHGNRLRNGQKPTQKPMHVVRKFVRSLCLAIPGEGCVGLGLVGASCMCWVLSVWLVGLLVAGVGGAAAGHARARSRRGGPHAERFCGCFPRFLARHGRRAQRRACCDEQWQRGDV